MDTYGIRIPDYVKEHEERIRQGAVTVEEHERKLKWLQHERLVHLFVTFFCIIIMFLCFIIYCVAPEDLKLPFAGIFFVLVVLNSFYLKHYFFLENHVQHWYRLYEELQKNRQ